MNARLLVVAAGVATVLALPAAAAAHSFDPGVLDVRERDGGVYDVLWLPPSAARSLAPGVAGARPRFPAHCRRLEPLGRASGTETGPGQTEVYRLDCGAAGLGGARLALPEIDGSPVDVIVRATWRDGEQTTAALRSGASELVLPAPAATAGEGASAPVVLWSYFFLGVQHIAIGADHLLFVLALLLLVDAMKTLFATITAFTVAHSLTLALAATGTLAIPAPPVEALIAGSIVLLAAELASPGATPSFTRRFPWVVAFTLGLLHGLGFAGALADVGLPRAQVALALVAFNLGVEAGQLAFVALAAVPVVLSRRLWGRYAWARLAPAYAIGAIASAWTIERVLRCFTRVA